MRTSRFRIRFAETKRIQSVDATELEAMIRDGRLDDDDLVALGGQFKRYWEHPRFADLKRPGASTAAGPKPADATTAPVPGAAPTVRGAPLPPDDPTPSPLDDAETSSLRRGPEDRGANGADPAPATIRADRARASVASGSRPRVQPLAEDRPPSRPDRPRPEELLQRAASRPRQATVPAPALGGARDPHRAPADEPGRTAPVASPPPARSPLRPRPAQRTAPAGRPVAEETKKNAPFHVPGADAGPIDTAEPQPPAPSAPSASDGLSVMPTAPRTETEAADPAASDPLDPRAVLIDGTRPVVPPEPAPVPAPAGDDAEPVLPSMRIADATDAPGRPFSDEELAMGPLALRDQLLNEPVAHILGIEGPGSRRVVNEAWKVRQKQIESTWPRLTPDPRIRAGRADLLRLLNSTMRVLTVPRELRRWQAREAELQRPAVYADLFEFSATSVAERPTNLREANARLAELAREEKLAGARLPRRQKGSTEGLDPAVIAAGFTNEMLEAAGQKKPQVSIADTRRAAEQRRLKVWASLLLIAAFLVFLSWTNACPQDLPS